MTFRHVHMGQIYKAVFYLSNDWYFYNQPIQQVYS